MNPQRLRNPIFEKSSQALADASQDPAKHIGTYLAERLTEKWIIYPEVSFYGRCHRFERKRNEKF